MKHLENTVGKEGNAGNQHFHLFPQCFLPFPKQVSIFSVTFILLSASSFNLDQSQNLSFGKDLNYICITKVKPVLEPTCIKRPPALEDHCSDTASLLKST